MSNKCCRWSVYWYAQFISYGDTSSCSACSGRAKYTDTTGSTSCKNVLAGYYTTGCKAGNIACTGQSKCTGATYCSRGVQNSCPTIYTDDTTAGKTAANQCQVRTDGGYYIAAAQDDEQTQCTTKHYCPSALVSYGSTNSPTACPSGYPNSAAGASVITQCYSNTKSRPWTGSQNACTKPSGCSTVTCNTCSKSACNYVAYANSAGTGDGTIMSGCSTNNESCNQTVKSVTANAGYRVNGTACTQCTGATYSAGGTATSCSNCPTIYTDDTTAGKSSASQCKVVTDPGYYIAANNDDKQTQCTTKHYCPSATISYGSHNAPTACPDPETHLTTEYPDSYYDAKFSVISVQAWFTGGVPWTKETDCRAVYSLDNSRGHLITDNVVYNASTQKYDQFIRWPYYVSINPGYYANGKYDEATCDNDNNTMLYKDAQPCPAGSYCPGLTSMPSCTSGTYNDTLGINACPANYGTSPAQSTANTQCYLTTTAGKWVATKNAAQTDCTAGGFCVGGVKVNYGSTGGRTPAAAGYYVSATGATAQTACAAGTYTSTTGQTKCTDAAAGTYTTGCKITSNNTACTGTAVCATNTYSDARASVCIACNTTDGYKNSGTTASDHAGIASCKVYCSGGEYVPVAGDGCVNVGVGYWGAGGTVSQTATLARNACDTGLTTIGSGAGADESGDCGRVLNVGDEKIYLRSTKKTTPSLNISINGDVFYGNMSTTDGGSSLRINSGGTVYSVYDDSNPPLPHSGGVD